MKFTMACSTWVKEEDEIVLKLVQKADRMPTVEELMEKTGLRRFRIEGTLKMMRKQIAMAESRKRLMDSDAFPEATAFLEELREEFRREQKLTGAEDDS